MLVLKRKQGQSIIIGGNIVVKIIEVEGKSVKVGIEAPKHINIVREELLERAKEKMIDATVKPDVAKAVRISESDKTKNSTEQSKEEREQIESKKRKQGEKTRRSSEEEKGNPKSSSEEDEEDEEKIIIIKKSESGSKRASANLKGE